MTKEPTEKAPTKKKPAQSSGFSEWVESDNFFWGLLLISLGALFLLHNVGVLQLYIGNIWQLWPIVIILIGVSMIQLKGKWNTAVNVGATIIIVLLALFVLTNENGLRQGPITHDSDDVVAIENRASLWQKTEKADVRVDTGAISLRLDSVPEGDSQVVNAQLKGNRKITEETRMDGTTQRIELGTKGHPGAGIFQGKNRLELGLTQRVPVDLRLDMGASTISGDLSQVQLENLIIDTGATTVDLTLGSKLERSTVTIDSGASNIKLRMPKEVGYRVERDGGLTSSNFDGAEKVSDDLYETEGFAQAEKQILIIADTGATSFKIEQY